MTSDASDRRVNVDDNRGRCRCQAAHSSFPPSAPSFIDALSRVLFIRFCVIRVCARSLLGAGREIVTVEGTGAEETERERASERASSGDSRREKK